MRSDAQVYQGNPSLGNQSREWEDFAGAGWRKFNPGPIIDYERPSMEYLAFLLDTPRTKGAKQEQLQAIRAEQYLCKLDPHYWLVCWVRTQDEHDSENPIKRWPDYPYQQVLTRAFFYQDSEGHYPPLFIGKSRQLMVTWQCVLLSLWTCMYGESRKAFFQSQKEEMACKLITDKAIVSLEKLPWFLQVDWKYKHGELYFPENNSYIFGVPKGADQARGFTATIWFADEAAFQDEFLDTYAAIRPMIDGGGRFVAVSTAAPGSFEKLYKGKI